MPTKNCPVCGHPIHTVPVNAEKARCGFCAQDRYFPRVPCSVRHDCGYKMLARYEVVEGRRVPVYEDCRTCMGTGMVWLPEEDQPEGEEDQSEG